MSQSIMIRHAPYKVDWTELDRKELEKLLYHEKDPEVDKEKLNQQLDSRKLRTQEFTKIYTSPVKRAKQTAEKLSEILDVPVNEKEDLGELKFSEVPEKIFEEGNEAVRQYLLDKTKQKNVDTDFLENIGEQKAVLVSHGFIMRKIHQELFETEFSSLRDNQMFRNYLTGFSLEDGDAVSLKQELNTGK